MAKLTTNARNNLKSSDFAIPPSNGKPGAYPIPDRSHAINALARAAQNASPAEQHQVAAAVAKKFPNLPSSKSRKK